MAPPSAHALRARAGGAERQARREAAGAEREAQRANASAVAGALARVGLGSRAVVYAVLGFLCADIALEGGAGKNASSQGALDELVRQPLGPALVVVLAAGFCCYAAWRLLQAAAGDPSEKRGAEAVVRVGWAAIGVVYIALAVRAAVLLAGRHSSSNTAFSVSKSLLDIGGPALLGALGVGVVGGGLGLAGWALAHDFTTRLDRHRMPAWLRRPSRGVEVAGNVVRGLALAGVGVTLVAAAVADRAKEAKGLNGSLHELASQPYGPALLGLVAAGFVAFALASLVEVCFRDVRGHRASPGPHAG